MKLYNLLDIRQSESEAFDIMTIASVCTVELVPYLPQDLLLHAYACITDGKAQVIVVIPCPYIYIQRLIRLGIFHGIVHQVEYRISEMYLVDKQCRVDSLYLSVYLAAGMLYSELERLCRILYKLVEVEFLWLEDSLLTVKQRHLQHLLHEEA